MHPTRLGLMLAMLPVAVTAQEREAHHHSHGEANLTVAIDGSDAVVTFEAPGADIVGFESTDGSAEQIARLDQAVEALGNHESLFTFAAEARCTMESGEVEADGYEAGERHGHAEFVAEYHFVCAQSPTGVEITLFDDYPGLVSVAVDAFSGGNVVSSKAVPSNRSVNW